MIFQKEFIKIGFIRKAHGVYGHAKVVIEEGFIEDLEESKFVFLKMDGCYIPYSIQEFHDTGDQILKLDSFDNPEELKELKDPSLFLIQDELKYAPAQTDASLKSNTLSGFELWDTKKGRLGLIDRVEEYPQQLMLVIIKADQSEVLIPFHDSLIDSIDDAQKRLIMELPDGLLNL